MSEDVGATQEATQEMNGVGADSTADEIPPDVWGQAYFNGTGSDHPHVDFTTDEIIFGRKANSHVRLMHPGTSSKHCVLRRMGGVGDSILMLTDTSTNGTFVNGTRIGNGQQLEIKNGQEIILIRTPQEKLSYIIRCYDQDKEHATEAKHPNGPYKKYVIGSTLGSGAYATVKRCVNKTTGEQFAIKVIDKHKFALNKGEGGTSPDAPDAVNNAQLTANLHAEVNILKSIDHPNIIKVEDVFETNRFFYIVLELVSGGDLLDFLINRKQPFTESEARRIFHQLVEATDYLHSQKIVHRDIKPENILLKTPGEIKLTDFGLSRIVGEGSFMKTVCGTPQYLAPEVLNMAPFMVQRGRQPSTTGYDKAVDMWSLGVILYVLLSASQPFDEGNLVDSILAGRFVFPTARWTGKSEAVKDLIRGLLRVDPAARYTAEQVRQHPWMHVGRPTPTAPKPALAPGTSIDARMNDQFVKLSGPAGAAANGGGNAVESKDNGASRRGRGAKRMPSNIMTISSLAPDANDDDDDDDEDGDGGDRYDDDEDDSVDGATSPAKRKGGDDQGPDAEKVVKKGRGGGGGC